MDCRTHPTHDGIFGDTYHGVPNPNVPHRHPYPTRFHGPIYTMPQAMLPYMDRPYALAPYAGVGSVGGCCVSCDDGGACEAGCSAVGEAPPLASSVTGLPAGDALIGAAVGYMIAPKKSERLKWTAVGGVATALLGTLGLLGTVVVVFAQKNGSGA